MIISPNTSAANAQQASQEINIINVSEPNAVQEITPPVEEIKVKKGVIQRIVEFLKNFFK